MNPIEVREYQMADGRSPFKQWLCRLRDPKGKRAIAARVRRMQADNRGDWKPLGLGLFELRISTGPGYRVYCGQDGADLVLLLCAGDKDTQKRDIKHARNYWTDYKARR